MSNLNVSTPYVDKDGTVYYDFEIGDIVHWLSARVYKLEKEIKRLKEKPKDE